MGDPVAVDGRGEAAKGGYAERDAELAAGLGDRGADSLAVLSAVFMPGPFRLSLILRLRCATRRRPAPSNPQSPTFSPRAGS